MLSGWVLWLLYLNNFANMKTYIITTLLPLFAVLALASNTYSQSIATSLSRTVLATLQDGESIMNSESCFMLSLNNSQLYLVTRHNNKFFIYENDKRKGPYTSLHDSMLKPCEQGRDSDEKCSVFKPAQNANQTEGITLNETGQYVIEFKGKTFGPYQYITNYNAYSDKTGFVAIAMDIQMKSTLITSEGTKTELNGDVETIYMSPVGKRYVFALKEREAFDPSILKMDFSKMTQQELIAFAQKQEDLKKQAVPPKSYVYVSGGKKLGPYEPSALSSNNPAFTKTGGDNWIMTLDNTLYINGNQVKTFENTDLNNCNIWLSQDGKRYAITSYDKIFFSDGKAYSYPMETATFENDGKVFLKWISLENEKDLVLYYREI